jgi:hypothetical protein
MNALHRVANKGPHGLLFRGQAFWIVEVVGPFTWAAAEAISTSSGLAGGVKLAGKREGVTERQTSALSTARGRIGRRVARTKSTEAGRTRCRRAIRR